MLQLGTYDLKGVGDDADSHELLSVVAAVHHERVGETLDDRALCLPEALCGVTASGVGDVDWGTDLDVIAVELYVSRCSHGSFLFWPKNGSFFVRAPLSNSPTKSRNRDSYVKEISRTSTSS